MGRKTLTTYIFIKRAEEIHGDKYDYSEVIYINAKTKVKIFCKECEDYFYQTPSHHIIKKHGCRKCCQNKNKKTLENFIKESIYIHENKYDYSEVIYINAKTKVKIFCKECNDYFEQIPNNHLNGAGCPICNDIKNTKEDFIKIAQKIHGNKFNYSNVNYVNSNTKIEIICNKCNNSFWKLPFNHLKIKSGCPICYYFNINISKASQEWLNYLNIPNSFREKIIKIENKSFRADAVDFEKKIVWEYYGTIWHGDLRHVNPDGINPFNKKTYLQLYENTIKRENILKSAGFTLIIMWEKEWIKFKKMNLIT